MTSLENETTEFRTLLLHLNAAYEDYARKAGVPSNTLAVMDFIYHEPDCTQKLICERTMLPKQTVNSVITSFYRQGLVELQEIPEDRRSKAVRLTALGRRTARRVVEDLRQVEATALQRFTPEQRKDTLDLMQELTRQLAAAEPSAQI